MTSVQDQGWPDEETLLAFADGRLEASEANRVQTYLDANPEARRLVDLLRRSGELAAVAYDDAMQVATPDKLVDMILNGPLEEVRPDLQVTVKVQNQAPSADVVPFAARRKKFIAQMSQSALALAASLALVVGSLIGYNIGKSDGGSAPFDVAVGHVAPGSLVETLLETRASGEPLDIASTGSASGGELMVIASFRDKQARACREFEATHPGESGDAITVAVACRTDRGQWFVEGAARLAASPEASSKDFSPASGNASSPVDGILSKIGARPALSTAEEKNLLDQRWK